MKYLIVVDMQKDFIDGALGTPEAVSIVPAVKEYIENFCGEIIFTRDTHHDDYMNTQEGKNLPVPHCIEDTEGWQIAKELIPLTEGKRVFDKPTFGSTHLAEYLKNQGDVDEVTLIGLCTDICVISNAMLIKAYLPEVKISVVEECCAGVTPDSHKRALDAMKVCQIEIK